MDGRLFGLDAQLLFDVLVMLVFIMVLFAIMSVLFFNPVRSFLEKRREALDEMAEETRKAQEQAQSLRMAYEEKLKDVDREIQILLTTKRREAFVQQENILNNAREQARLRMEAEKKAVSREKMQAQEAIMRQAEVLGCAYGVAVYNGEASGECGWLCGRCLQKVYGRYGFNSTATSGNRARGKRACGNRVRLRSRRAFRNGWKC